MPLSLSDDELSAVQRAAAPVHPMQRGDFLKALATELERHPVVGPGLVHRLAADLQRRYVIAPERETSPEPPSAEGALGRRLSLSDAEYAAVQAAAAPVHPPQRGAFPKALTEELERYPTIGPGLVHRCAADLQKRYGVTVHSETLRATEPRHLSRRKKARA